MRISDWSSDVCSSDLLAEDFVGNDGLDRDGARRLAAVYFMRNASIGVTPGPLEVELQGDHATVRTTVVLTGGSGGILPDTGRIRDVPTGWRREDGDWLRSSLRGEGGCAGGLHPYKNGRTEGR